MTKHLTPQQILDLACQKSVHGDAPQTLQLHLAGCRECRRALLEAEALQALAVEAGPAGDESALHALGLTAAKSGIQRQIAEDVGEEAARELLAPPERATPNPKAFWAALAAGVAAALLGGLLWWQSRQESKSVAEAGLPPTWNATPAPTYDPLAPAPLGPQAQAPAPSEFDASAAPTAPAPASAAPHNPAAAMPADEPDKVDPVSPAERAAKKLLIQHSKEARRHHKTKPAAKKAAKPKAKPKPTAATPVPASAPQPTPQAAPPGGLPQADAAQQPGGLELVRTSFAPAQGQKAELAVVGAGPADVEVRIFTSRSRSVRFMNLSLGAGGRVAITWDGKDDAGADMAAGTYYVRVTTPWFIRTEPLELTR